LAHSSLSSARIAGISVGLAVFVAVYWSLMPPVRWLRCRAEVWTNGAFAVLPAIAGGLLLAGAPSSFTALFVYVVAVAGFLLPLWPALAVVLLTAVGVGVGTAATGSDAGAVAAWVLTIVSIGAIMAGGGGVVPGHPEPRAPRDRAARRAPPPGRAAGAPAPPRLP